MFKCPDPTGVAYNEHHFTAQPLPSSGVVSGRIELEGIAGAFLAYSVRLEVGTLIEGELCEVGG